MSSSVYMVYVTFPDRETAKRICRLLVEEGLAACANILGDTHSIYEWDGTVQEEGEVSATLKTRASRFEALKNKVLAEHPYEVPCILAWPVAEGHDAFLDWIETQTTESR